MGVKISDSKSRELIVRFRKGDQRAFNILVESNQGLVIKIARHYTYNPDFLNDIIQEGNLGLIRAIQKFNLDGETMLSTYASIWIKSNIETYISKSVYSINVAQSTRKLALKVTKMYKKLINSEFSESEAVEIISKDLDIEKSAVSKLAALQNACSSINAKKYSESEDSSEEVQDSIKSNISVEDEIISDMISESIVSLVLQLPERQRDVISLFYGIGRYPEISSFSGIARQIGVSREYARILYNNGMKELRKSKNEINELAA